jgi:succinate dehydrogenase / fumarate reductase cytochrome b subunit
MSPSQHAASIDSPHFLFRRLHSLLGLLPVGAFLIFHLWENSQSRFGAEHYNEHVVAALQRMNYLPVLEIFVIALPLLFHAGYGLVITAQMRAELGRYPYARHRLYWLQRVSGIGILLFLLMHVGMTRIAGIADPTMSDDLFAHMQSQLHVPWILGLYLIGLLLSVVHLANGLASMAIVWGLTTSARAQRLFGRVCVVIGVLLAALGLHGLMGFLT